MDFDQFMHLQMQAAQRGHVRAVRALEQFEEQLNSDDEHDCTSQQEADLEAEQEAEQDQENERALREGGYT